MLQKPNLIKPCFISPVVGIIGISDIRAPLVEAFSLDRARHRPRNSVQRNFSCWSSPGSGILHTRPPLVGGDSGIHLPHDRGPAVRIFFPHWNPVRTTPLIDFPMTK